MLHRGTHHSQYRHEQMPAIQASVRCSIKGGGHIADRAVAPPKTGFVSSPSRCQNVLSNGTSPQRSSDHFHGRRFILSICRPAKMDLMLHRDRKATVRQNAIAQLSFAQRGK
uniref:Uncharacterized protein n=1 Tax=Odontella aurita TaxID=265563 RepID=A0A7S4M4R6_9STRA